MSITTNRHESTQVTAVVAVRVPQNADGDLATETQRRLSRIDGVHDVTVDGFQAIEPRLSATVVTVTAAIETHRSDTELHDELSGTVGVEAVEQLEQTGRV